MDAEFELTDAITRDSPQSVRVVSDSDIDEKSPRKQNKLVSVIEICRLIRIVD